MPIEDFNDENLEIITRKGKAIANEMAPRIRKWFAVLMALELVLQIKHF
jgi:hypothetical protein